MAPPGLCPGGCKVCHATKSDALAALARVRRETGMQGGRVYPCGACQCWHVTSRRWKPPLGRRK